MRPAWAARERSTAKTISTPAAPPRAGRSRWGMIVSFSMEILSLMSRDRQRHRRYPIEWIRFDSEYVRLDQSLRYEMIKRDDGIVSEHLSFAGLEQFAAPCRVHCGRRFIEQLVVGWICVSCIVIFRIHAQGIQKV